MNSFIPWTGGKKNLREAAVLRFPLKYERYIEAFGGGNPEMWIYPKDMTQEEVWEMAEHLFVHTMQLVLHL